eukprot:gene6472-4656_t
MGNARIAKIWPNGSVESIVGTGVFSPFQYNDGTAGTATGLASVGCYPSNHVATKNTLLYPYAVYVDVNGTIFVADTNNYRIVRVDANNTMTTIIGTGLTPATCCDGNHSLATNVGRVYGLSGSSDGVIYFAEYSEARIRAWYPNTSLVYTVAGVNPAFRFGFTPDGESIKGGRIAYPWGIFVEDESRTMYYTDNTFCLIRSFSLDTYIVSTIAGSGNCQSNQMYPWQVGRDYYASQVYTSAVYNVWANRNGEVFFSDSWNFVWRVYNGFARIFAGNGVYDTSAEYVQATSTTIASPRGITGDDFGNIYIVSSGENIVLKVTTNGTMYRIAGSSTWGYVDCTLATLGQMASPQGIAIDTSGNLYVADTSAHTIRRISETAYCSPTPTPTEAPSDVLVLSPAGTFTCTWTNTSALTIQLSGGSSSTFGIGSQVGLVSGLSSLRPLSLADGQTFSVAGRMVTVRSPVEPVRPSVVIKASTTISSCADWSVDLTRSTGNAGRTWTNTSVSVSLLPAAADNSSAVLASRLLSSLSTSFPMAVPNAWLSSGVQYSVSIRLCNYLGGCGVGTAKVFVSNTSLSAPVVSILGNAAVSTYVNRSITVAASAYVPLCFGQQRTSGLSYTWSVWSGSSPVTVVNRAADPSTLMLAAYALSASSVYTVRVVVEDSRSQRSSQATMSLTTLSSALVARISPAVSSVLGVGQSVTLDASSSFDPDSSSATLSYTWTTTLVSSVTGVAVASDSPIALQVTNKSSSSIRSVALVTGVEYVANVTAIVRVTVSSGSKTGSASTAFRILSEPIPSVAISTTAAAVTNVDASRSVSLVGAVQAASTTTATWSVTGLSSSALTAMVAGGTTSFAVTANRATSATLFLLPNALDAGANLETSVQQTNLDEASVASVALNVASLIASAASVSEANAATTVNVATALVGAAAASSASIPATSLTRLLTPLDHALRHVANRTVSEAAVNASVIVQTLEAYAATAAVAALPDADATTAVHSMYRLSTQAFALSTTGTLNSSLSVPTTALEAAQSVAQTNLRLQTNLSSGSEEASLLASANAIAVQLMEYPQRVLAASTAATVKSNLVSVATHALDATGDVLGEVSSFDIEINVTKVCPGSNHTLTFACNGHRSGVWRKHCPVLQPTCYGLTAQEAFAASSSSSSSASTDADRVSCVPKTVTSESTVCTCTIPESRRRRRRRLTTTSIEQKADYLAVIVTYVASNFVDTFEETNAVGPDVLQKSYIVLALYGSLWVSCAIFMVVLYRKAQVDEAKKREAAIQRRHHSRVSPSVTAGSLLNAPSTEDLRNAAHASSAFEKLHASVMTGVRRASVAMHAILPTTRSDNAVAAARKSTLILHTTHIPEDTHEARKEIRVAMQELEQRQPGSSRLASTLHRSRMASLSKMAAPSVDMNGSDAAELDTDVVLSPQMILHALRQQRTRLTGAKLDAFDRAWYFLLHYDQWRVEMDAERRAQWMARLISACADGGRRARVRREGLPTRVEDFVGQLLVDTVTSTVQETRIVDGLTDVEAGLHILQTFVRDILGQHTSVAKIFLAKAQAEFYRTNAVSRRVKALAIGVILAVNGFCLYFSIVRGYVKGLQWQAAYAMSCVIQLATEVLFFETLETMWVDFLLPNFAFAEMRRCHDILRAMVDSLSELMESEALQVRRGGHGSGSGEGSPSPVSSSSSSSSSAPCVLNVPQHFYISNQLARRNPTLIESMMVLSYESYLPVGLDTGSDLTNGGADDVVGMHRRGLFCISWVSYFSATFLALVAAVPFEFHRLVIRFFSPFLVGGLVLAWAYISVNVLFLALFFGGVGAIALYVAYVVWKLHKQTRVVDGAPVEPLTTARESKPPLVVGAAASAAPAAVDTRLMVVPVTSASSPAAAETMPALSPVYPRHVRSPPSSSPSRGTLSSTDAVKAAAARLVESPCEDGKDDSRPRDDHHYHQTRDTAKERRPSLHQQRSHRDASQNHSGSDSDRSRSDSSDSDSSDGDGMSMASFLSFDLDARSRSVSLVEVASGSSKNVRRRNRSENGREGSLDTMPLPSESSQGGLRRRVSSTGSQQSTNATVTTNTSVPVRLVQPSVRHAHSSRPPARSEPMFFADELPADDNGRQEETMVAAPARPRNASKTTPSPRVARPKK